MGKEKLVTQIALFQSPSQKKMELSINGSLQEIATLGHTYKGLRTWSENRGDYLVWNAVLEYEMALSTLVGVNSGDTLEKIMQLKKYRINPNHSMNDLGMIGTQAFIIQNDLFDVTLKESFGDLKKAVFDTFDFGSDDPVEILISEILKQKTSLIDEDNREGH